MTKKLKFGAVLLALALTMPAVAFLLYARVIPVAVIFSAGLGAVGVVTITYESLQHTGAFGGGFVGGTNVAPTAAQSNGAAAITALVAFTDSDTTWVLTHNWGLTAAQIAALLPEVIINPVSGVQAAAVYPVIALDRTNGNQVTFTKVSAVNSGMTVSVTLRRPHSIGL